MPCLPSEALALTLPPWILLSSCHRWSTPPWWVTLCMSPGLPSRTSSLRVAWLPWHAPASCASSTPKIKWEICVGVRPWGQPLWLRTASVGWKSLSGRKVYVAYLFTHLWQGRRFAIKGGGGTSTLFFAQSGWYWWSVIDNELVVDLQWAWLQFI